MKNVLLSIGHGYTAQAFASKLSRDRWKVIGTSRSKGIRKIIGIEPIIWPGEEMRDAIKSATHILSSVAPTESGDAVLHEFSNEIAQAPNLKWIGYLSTTAVYGDHQGDWVDENTATAPRTKRGKYREKAELDWLEFARTHSLTLQVFRLAGIYGPGRGPFSKVCSGTARRIIKANQVFSRIHVEDIAQVLLASVESPNPGAIYNVCDDLAAPPQDVIEYASELLGLPVPVSEDWETAEMTPMARSFYGESKKVRNRKIKEELRVKLLFPDYRTGLKALLEQSDN